MAARRGAVSGSVKGACANANLAEMKNCACVDPKAESPVPLVEEDLDDDYEDFDDYDETDLVGLGLIDVRVFDPSACKKKEVTRCNPGASTGVPIPQLPKKEAPVLRDVDYCVEYDTIYRNGSLIRGYKNIPSVEDCRARCIGHKKGCLYYTYLGLNDKKRCLLYSSGNFDLRRRKGAVSGAVSGECSTLPFDNMKSCTCVDLKEEKAAAAAINNNNNNNDDYDDDYYDDVDLVGSGLIDVRVNLGCGKREISRCAKGRAATPVINNNNNNSPVATPTGDGETCAEYDTIYTGPGQQDRKNRISGPDECRAICQQTTGCRYWSFKGGARNKPCFLRGEGTKYRKKHEYGAISGSIGGSCAAVSVSGATNCECVTLPKRPNAKPKTPGTAADQANTCPDEQSKRCFAPPVQSAPINSRVFFG